MTQESPKGRIVHYTTKCTVKSYTLCYEGNLRDNLTDYVATSLDDVTCKECLKIAKDIGKQIIESFYFTKTNTRKFKESN